MLRSLLVPSLFLLSLLAAACTAGPGATTAPTAAPPTDAPTQAPATAAPPTATAEPSMAVSETVSIAEGGHLVGPNGLALYTFDNDAPGTSNCEGECLVNWPALLVDSASDISVGDGLDAGEFEAITRSDGTLQVVHNEMPLYYFIGDAAPGEVNGDGLNDVWHLAVVAQTDTAVSVGPEGYFVGYEGHTLYLFDNDEPGVSNCTGGCLVNWPPLLVASVQELAVGPGLDTADFATITRDDGALQVTYQQMPLYFFIGDAAAGDINGDLVNDVWHIVPAEDTSASPPPDDYIDY